jgi:hypothetical protein
MGIISKPYNFTTGVVNPDEANANFDTLFTLVNGELDGSNIADGAIDDDNLNTSISPVKRWGETFRDYVVSDLTVTNVGLDCAVLAGIAYVSGERIESVGSGHTVQDETTTYCDLSSDGTFSWNSNASPLSGYLRLAKIVSTAGDCTITDMRTFNPLAVWDLESEIATTPDAETASATMATLLTVTMLDVEDGDTLIMAVTGNFYANTNTVGASFNFYVGGVANTLIFQKYLTVEMGLNALTFIDIYPVVADAATLEVDFQWASSASKLMVNHRGLYVVRFRPTR